MPIRYLCLDDEAANVGPITQILQRVNADLKIDIKSPAPFDDEIRQLGRGDFDGLLLDLRLDRAADLTGHRVNYRALSLAQELRTRMTEGNIKSCPLVLWSVDDNFQKSFDRDVTGHDLFDARYYKAAINVGKKSVAAEMIDLATGYKIINETKSRTVKNIYSRLIELPDAFETLDPRIAEDLADNRAYPAHVFAHSILRNLVSAPGPLIDERLLAARLGVDIDRSADWAKLKSAVSEIALYKGVFGSASQRWWMYKVSSFWKDICKETPLQRLDADDRVALLKKSLKIAQLSAAKPILNTYDQRFWHVCKFLEQPISPTDAVQLSVERREWQDGAYASLKAILDRKHKASGYEVHSFERPRIDEMMSELRRGKN